MFFKGCCLNSGIYSVTFHYIKELKRKCMVYNKEQFIPCKIKVDMFIKLINFYYRNKPLFVLTKNF